MLEKEYTLKKPVRGMFLSYWCMLGGSVTDRNALWGISPMYGETLLQGKSRNKDLLLEVVQMVSLGQ